MFENCIRVFISNLESITLNICDCLGGGGGFLEGSVQFKGDTTLIDANKQIHEQCIVMLRLSAETFV